MNHIKRQRNNVSLDALECPFFDMSKKENHCLIYEVRPQICKSYKCNELGYYHKELLDGQRVVHLMSHVIFNEK